MSEIFYPEVGILKIHPVTEISFLRLPAFKHDRTFQIGKFFRARFFHRNRKFDKVKADKKETPDVEKPNSSSLDQ